MGGYNWSCLSNNTWYVATKKTGRDAPRRLKICHLPAMINQSTAHLFYKTLRLSSPTHSFVAGNWSPDCLYASKAASMFSLKNFIKFILVTSPFSLCTEASEQIFSTDLKNSLKYSIHNISINSPFLNTAEESSPEMRKHQFLPWCNFLFDDFIDF